MARPKKLTLDFFVHDSFASTDIKIRRLEKRHRCEGYSTFFKLLELLCQHDGMRLPLDDVGVLEILADDFNLRDATHLTTIIQDCVEIGLFDRQMWQSERVVFSQGLYQRYMSRLEDRKQAAIRQKRSKEAKSLTDRIIEVESQVITENHTVITCDNSPDIRDQNTELKDQKKDLRSTHTDPDRACVRENEQVKPEPDQPKTVSQFVEPSEEITPLSKWKSSVQSSEDKFRPPAPWRVSRNRNDYKPAFVEAVRLYMTDLPNYRGKTVTAAHAKGWIAKREYDEQGLSEIEIRWEAFQPSPATVSSSPTETDWETDPRTAGWSEEFKKMGPNRFRVAADGRIDPERSAFCKWVDKTQGAYL